MGGWKQVETGDKKTNSQWVRPSHAKGNGYITTRKGAWKSPEFSVKPFQYYRLYFRSRSSKSGYWAWVFYNRHGNRMSADHYSEIDPCKSWQDNEFRVQAEAEAKTARIMFESTGDIELSIDEVIVHPVSSNEVARWADKIYKNLPPLDYIPSKSRWGYMGDTIKRLKDQLSVRVLVLGDSIANDLANSAFDVLIERNWPNTDVNVISSVGNGTGCSYYRDQNRVKQYVIEKRPDLLVIAGISHHFEIEPIRDVIQQVRGEINPDILVLTGAITPPSQMLETRVKAGANRAKTRQKMEAFPEKVARMAREEKVEFLDMRKIWENYLSSNDKPREMFMRDKIHANTRGKQIMGRILARYLSLRQPAPLK